jgi:hypothetical protein
LLILLVPGAITSFWPTNASRSAAVHSNAQKGVSGAAADSMSTTIEPGRTLILQLPDSVAGEAVRGFENLHIPVLSWRSDRAFFWQTTTQDRGRHTLLFRSTDVSGRLDTLVVVVDVGP